MPALKIDVLNYLSSRHSDLFKGWTEGGELPEASIEQHCDLVYSLYLTGSISLISPHALEKFCDIAHKSRLPGLSGGVTPNQVSVHNFAYLLGAMNLLRSHFEDLYPRFLHGRDFVPGELIDEHTFSPKFPKRWSHHSWRVSHWLGGIPSIFLSLERSSPFASQINGFTKRIRDSVDDLLDPKTGLIRAYKSELLQKLFRVGYSIRHDPELGDLGGLAHILWIDHATDRRYVALPQVRSAASKLFLRHKPFMEAVPYCLDFDIIQALRTASSQLGLSLEEEKLRASEMMAGIEEFYRKPTSGYSLHKVPGAIATYHECALFLGQTYVDSLDCTAVDIIKSAYWL